jgi:hypothetical protein
MIGAMEMELLHAMEFLVMAQMDFFFTRLVVSEAGV